MYFNYGDVYKVIYFSNVLVVLFKSEKESSSTALETNYSFNKILKK